MANSSIIESASLARVICFISPDGLLCKAHMILCGAGQGPSKRPMLQPICSGTLPVLKSWQSRSGWSFAVHSESQLRHVYQALHGKNHTRNMCTSLCMFQITHATSAPVFACVGLYIQHVHQPCMAQIWCVITPCSIHCRDCY